MDSDGTLVFDQPLNLNDLFVHELCVVTFTLIYKVPPPCEPQKQNEKQKKKNRKQLINTHKKQNRTTRLKIKKYKQMKYSWFLVRLKIY